MPSNPREALARPVHALKKTPSPFWMAVGETKQKTILKRRAQVNRRLVREEGRLHPLWTLRKDPGRQRPDLGPPDARPWDPTHGARLWFSRAYHGNNDSILVVVRNKPQCSTHEEHSGNARDFTTGPGRASFQHPSCTIF